MIQTVKALLLGLGLLVSLCAASGAAQAQTQTRTPAAASLSATPYAGTMRLQVDATDLERKIFRVKQSLPVKPGPMALHYPEWLPGTHSPRGPLPLLAGLQMTADGARVEWLRDPLDAYTFTFNVPAGATQLDVSFDFLSSVDGDNGRVQATPDIVGIQWITLLLYPRGYDTADIAVQASLKLPEGWNFGSALTVASRSGSNGSSTLNFAPVSVGTLADSPLFAGKYFQRVDLDPQAKAAGRAPVFLDLVADNAAELAAAKPEYLAAHAALVAQADRLFGHRPYAHYDLLLAVSDSFSGIGLEHQQSSENGVAAGYFTDWAKRAPGRDLLPHEYVHAWNGKYRRPADLSTPTFNTPMQDSLLWVYEGQTQFWGTVLAARAGLHSAADARDDLALTAARFEARAGRAWRNLQDTTNEPVISGRRAGNWANWQRGGDYYDEARLFWIEADMLIREASNGQRSMDDFARAFFGASFAASSTAASSTAAKATPLAAPAEHPSTYTFADVVSTLNAVQPRDWAAFLRARLDGHGPGAPLGGLALGGWKLVFSEQPSEYFKTVEARRKVADFSYSIGIVVGKMDHIDSVDWGSPAFNASLTATGTLLAVNGVAYTAERLKSAITAAKVGGTPIELLVKAGDRFRSINIDYRGGLRYPALERVAGTPDRLSELFKPK